jgi:hypothetical protein
MCSCIYVSPIILSFSTHPDVTNKKLAISFSKKLLHMLSLIRLPLWSSGQSSWLQIRMPGFDSRHYQKKKLVDLERGPHSLVSTTEELLDRKLAAPV